MNRTVVHPKFPMNDTLRWLSAGIQSADADRQAAALREMVGKLGASAAWQLASDCGVACILGHGCPDQASSHEPWEPFVAAHRVVGERIRWYLRELDNVAAALASRGVSVVALKNAGIARGLFPCAGCCPMGDVDVLVRRRDFLRAHDVLVGAGYQFEFRSPLEVADALAAERSGGTEYWKPGPGGEKFWLELQWRPVAGRWIRPDQEPSADELMDRSLPLAGTDVRLLAPNDNLLQVALHTAKHSYVRAPGFRLHTDVDRIVLNQQVAWEPFVRQARQLQVRTAVYFSLLLARQLLETPIPDGVLDDLYPGRGKSRWIARQLVNAGLLDPDGVKFSRGAYVAFNAALYDDWPGLARAAFPGKTWMRQRYGVQSGWMLPVCYLRRGMDLLFRRNAT